MTNVPLTTDRLWARGEACPYDEIIDVRSPGEYALDHIPAAINLPVLSDEQRAEVGTLHQASAFEARKLGAAYVSGNISQHLATHFSSREKHYRPLIYCWRGGHRSNSLATVLARIGWRVTLLTGGYKTYRAHVLRELSEVPGNFEYRMITGPTGSGKTMLLERLAARGAQVLDLEKLANHRGSILGDLGPQPAQKAFESRLLSAYHHFDMQQPVWVEAESHRIGNLYLPSALWDKMCAATGVELRTPVPVRVRHLLAEYGHYVANPALLLEKLHRLSSRHGRKQLEVWERQVAHGEWEEFVASLLAIHYDPGYATSTNRCFPCVAGSVELHSEQPSAYEQVVDELLAAEVCLRTCSVPHFPVVNAANVLATPPSDASPE